MKKLMIMAVAALFAFTAVAQNTPAKKAETKAEKRASKSPEERAKNKANKMKAELKLSDDQAKKVEQVYLAEDKDMEAIRADKSLSKEDRNKKLKAARETARKGYESILTSDQKEIQKKNFEAKKAKAAERKALKKAENGTK